MLRSAVDSSNITEVAWEDGNLLVTFKKRGDVGVYYGVPEFKYHDMIKAESVGRYLNSEIKPYYRYELLSPPTSGPSTSNIEADAVAHSHDQ